MIKISIPESLFIKQKVFYTGNAAENMIIEGKQSVVVFFESKDSEQIPIAESEQLFKILTACKLSKDEVLLINTAFNHSVLSALRAVYPVKVVLLFGDISVSNNMKLQNYVTVTLDGISLLKSEALPVLVSSVDKKKKLWIELQKIFGL